MFLHDSVGKAPPHGESDSANSTAGSLFLATPSLGSSLDHSIHGKPSTRRRWQSPMANADCLAAQAEIQSILPLTLLNYYQWQHCLTLPLRCAYESFNFWVGGSSISSSRSNHGRSNHGRSINSIPEANCDKRQQRVLAPGAGTIIQHGWLANYISLVANAFKTSCLAGR